MITLNDMKKDAIMNHRTFCCPVTGEILDFRRSDFVAFKTDNGEKLAIVSVNGINDLNNSRLKSDERFRVLKTIEEVEECLAKINT